MRKQLIGILALATMVLATFGTAHPAVTQASSGNANSHALGTDVSGKKVVFIIYSAANVQFFAPVVQGAKDAAKVFGLNLSIEYGDSNNVKQNNLIETAIAQHAAALAVSIPDDNAFTKSICDVAGKGIPVVSFNVDATKGPVLNCRLAFIGQDFVASGALIAQRMINDKLIKAGDHVYCPVEAPQAVYAISRYAGVKQALGKIGATCDLANSTFSLADAQTAETQYLLGHRNTKAIIGLGSVPLTVAPKSVKAAGMNIPIGGFDLTQDIIKAIQTGTIVATVDQQPYAQGYYPVAQLALDLKYGLHPSSMNTGAGLVDKSNVNTVATLAGPIR
jgi:simple sugar transport system substrate-binding protein